MKLLFQRGHHAGALYGYVDLIVERKRTIVEIAGADVGPDAIDRDDLSVQLGLLVTVWVSRCPGRLSSDCERVEPILRICLQVSPWGAATCLVP